MLRRVWAAAFAAALMAGCGSGVPLPPGPATAPEGATASKIALGDPANRGRRAASSPGDAGAPDATAPRADFGQIKPSAQARHTADWVLHSGDHGQRPFAIVDKKAARLFVFHADGRLKGASPVLLGLAKGDDSVPGIGEREMSAIRPHERTTPAGRFVVEPGVNLTGEDILWVDYDSAVSMHRVRATNPRERRLERLASATPSDNRISYGCINVPARFYDKVLQKALGSARSVVYVLPETRSPQQQFGSYDVPPSDAGSRQAGAGRGTPADKGGVKTASKAQPKTASKTALAAGRASADSSKGL